MEGYQLLARAVLKSTAHDLARGARGPRRRHYMSARRFLDMPLFGLMCRLAGCRPEAVRAEMLRRTGARARTRSRPAPRTAAKR